MTGAANRRKGAGYELDVAHYLAANGYPDAHRELEKRRDIGDIANGPAGVTIECKNRSKLDLAGWLGQAEQAAINTGAAHAAVIIKARGRTVGQSYVVQRFEDWLDMLKETGR